MAKSKGKQILVTNIETGEIKEYVSMRKTALSLNTSLATVRNYIKDKKFFLGKFKIIIKI